MLLTNNVLNQHKSLFLLLEWLFLCSTVSYILLKVWECFILRDELERVNVRFCCRRFYLLMFRLANSIQGGGCEIAAVFISSFPFFLISIYFTIF